MNTKDILNKFDKAKKLNNKYQANELFELLKDIANSLEASDIEEYSILGTSMLEDLYDGFVNDDYIENTLIPNRTESQGAQGVLNLLLDYDNGYYIHAIDAYNNIDDTQVMDYLADYATDYYNDFIQAGELDGDIDIIRRNK